jgi:hypothetical protein
MLVVHSPAEIPLLEVFALDELMYGLTVGLDGHTTTSPCSSLMVTGSITPLAPRLVVSSYDRSVVYPEGEYLDPIAMLQLMRSYMMVGLYCGGKSNT